MFTSQNDWRLSNSIRHGYTSLDSLLNELASDPNAIMNTTREELYKHINDFEALCRTIETLLSFSSSMDTGSPTEAQTVASSDSNGSSSGSSMEVDCFN